jgi:chemotaxis protein histidine kinase CheA
VACLRSGTYGAISLGQVLGIESSETEKEATMEGVLINGETGTMLLLVESVLGQRKVVVSDLTDVLADCDRISGVAQLGAGKLALVLSATELIRAASNANEGSKFGK